jgi:hypothetical protein
MALLVGSKTLGVHATFDNRTVRLPRQPHAERLYAERRNGR